MRTILGLAALAAVANGQTVTPVLTSPCNTAITTITTAASSGTVTTPGCGSLSPAVSGQPFTTLHVYNVNAVSGSTTYTAGADITPSGVSKNYIPQSQQPSNTANPDVGSGTYSMTVPYAVTALQVTMITNHYVGELTYRWTPGYVLNGVASTSTALTCDPCTTTGITSATAVAPTMGTSTNCDWATGPGTSPSPQAGFRCADMTRTYSWTGLAATGTTAVVNKFFWYVYTTDTPPTQTSYTLSVTRQNNVAITGDPQIVGMQGQDFQVHGMPDEIFNMVSYPTLQVNARFTYLESAECNDNYTACFAHPGTYISEEGFRVGKDKIRVSAGSFKQGLTVHVNGKKIKSHVDLKNGAVEIVNHRRAIVHTDVMKITMTNSDKFMNQELELMNPELITLGGNRRVLKDNERFHPEIPLHGLQGQTWRNVEYPSGLDYEGSIMDYHVVSGNLYGTDFVFNQFSS